MIVFYNFGAWLLITTQIYDDYHNFPDETLGELILIHAWHHQSVKNHNTTLLNFLRSFWDHRWVSLMNLCIVIFIIYQAFQLLKLLIKKMFSILDKRFFCKDETVKDEENCDIIKKNKIQLRFYIFSILINNDTLIKLLKNYRKSPLLKIWKKQDYKLS
jgi:hypothetical protein